MMNKHNSSQDRIWSLLIAEAEEPYASGGVCLRGEGSVLAAGFLCDEMGLGKTLETLMLVLASQPPKGWAVQDLSKMQSAQQLEPVPIRSTLIVMPANLLQQWQDELSTHVKRGALKW